MVPKAFIIAEVAYFMSCHKVILRHRALLIIINLTILQSSVTTVFNEYLEKDIRHTCDAISVEISGDSGENIEN